MLPFCGYNMGDYFAHWLEMGRREGAQLPRLFYVNWFRKDDDGDFMWPGFGDNSRVLAWIFRRCEGKADAVESPLGLLPTTGAIDTTGLDLSEETLEKLLSVDTEAVRANLDQIAAHLDRFGDKLPEELRGQLKALESRLA
jgi:phosphoenolpyruvate carboxykinase (GTP)